MIWKGLFYGSSGLAEVSRKLVLELAELGAPISISPLDIDSSSFVSPKDLKKLKNLEDQYGSEHKSQVYAIQPTYYQASLNINIGFTMFETDRIPKKWTRLCNQMTEIWVPSMFNYYSFLNSGVKDEKLSIIPLGVDTNLFSPEVQPLKLSGMKDFNFLSIFFWSLRKGWDVLFRAYFNEFKAEEDVCLVIRAAEVDYNELHNFLSQFEEPRPSVLLIPFGIRWDLLPMLYKSADCFVLPSRGEGWGLPFCHAMATEVPVIGTRWGGNLEFMTDDNSYLIDVTGKSPIDHQMVEITGAEPDHLWAEPDEDNLRSLMREVFEKRAAAKEKAKKARKHLQDNFSWKLSALKILERLDALGGLD